MIKQKTPLKGVKSKSIEIITGKDGKIKRNTKHSFNPLIPSVLSIEVCLINRKAYLGMIEMYSDSTFVSTDKRWKDLIKMDNDSLFELFQSRWEKGRATNG